MGTRGGCRDLEGTVLVVLPKLGVEGRQYCPPALIVPVVQRGYWSSP